MRILLFNWRDWTHPAAGGAETYTRELFHHWVAQGHDVHLFTSTVPGRPDTEVLDGVRVIRRGGRLTVYAEAREYYRTEGFGRFDLVIDEVNTRPFLCPQFVWDVPVVAIVHQVARELWFQELPLPTALYGRYLLEPSWLRHYRDVPVVAVSPSTLDSLAGYGLRNVRLVPEGWRRPEISNPVKDRQPTMLFLGRLVRGKRPDHTLQAFRLVKESVPDARLWIVGSGPMEDELKADAPAGVEFFGRVSETRKYELLGRAHVLVATSIREGWGLVVTEAASVGTATIAYDVPGLHDSVGCCGGRLVDSDPEALAAAVVDALSAEHPLTVTDPGVAGLPLWGEVADRVLAAREWSPPPTGTPPVVATLEEDTPPAPEVPAQNDEVPNAPEQAPPERLGGWRRRLALGGVAVLALDGAVQGTRLESAVAATAFTALTLATVIGLVEARNARGTRPARGGPVSAGRSGWAATLAIAILAGVTAQTWFAGGPVGSGDLSPPGGTAWLARLFSPWSLHHGTVGPLGSVETSLPWGIVSELVHALSGSAVLAQRLFDTGLFVGAGLAAVFLLRTIGLTPSASFVGAAAYLFNPVVFSLVGRNPVFLAGMVLLPLLPAFPLSAGAGRLRPVRAAAGLAVASPLLATAFGNPPLAGAVLVLVLLTPLLSGWLWGAPAARLAGRTIAVGAPLMVLISAYWIVPEVLQLTQSTVGGLSHASSWSWTETRSTLSNAFWLNTNWAWAHPEYFSYAHTYGEFPLALLRYLLPCAAFASLALVRPRLSRGGLMSLRFRATLAAAATALILILLSTGTRPPGSVIFNVLYRLPGGWLLAEPGRFLIVVSMAYAVMLGVTITIVLAGVRSRVVEDRLPVISFPRVMAVGAATASIVFGVGYPVALSQVTTSTTQAQFHGMPAYWPSMARAVDAYPAPGPAVMLPPDDFYQMPYTWYYGNDGFISDLMKRSVVDPTSQGYFAAPATEISLVNGLATSLLSGDWPLARHVMLAMQSPLIVVRGDVLTTAPGRATSILPPSSLARALDADPLMKLVRTDGPLRLYAIRRPLRAGPAPVATTASPAPDWRSLALLPEGTQMVTHSPLPGTTDVIDLPDPAAWSVSASGVASTTVPIPPVSAVQVWTEPPGSGARPVALQPAAGARTSGGISFSTDAAHLSLTVNTATVSLISGRPSPSPPQAEDCDKVLPPSRAQLASADLAGRGPGNTDVIRLSALRDSACVQQALSMPTGPTSLRLWVRNVAGAAPRICLWETGPNRCASLPPLPSGPGWRHIAATVSVDPGTTALTLYLYADGGAPHRTVDDYAGVQVYSVPVGKIVALAVPIGRAAGGPQVVALAQTGVAGWSGPTGARAVTVDGAYPGWLIRPGEAGGLRYRPAGWLRAGAWVSAAAALLVGIMAFSGLRRPRRVRS